MDKRNRRVPPRSNPGQEQQQQAQAPPPVATIPWKLLVVSTGITTIFGYVFLEGIRMVHRGIARRREDRMAAATPGLSAGQADAMPPPAPGSLANGSFQLPLPSGANPVDVAGPPQVGFGQPRLVDVNNPLGQLQHQMQQQAAVSDARFNRIESLLQNHYGRSG